MIDVMTDKQMAFIASLIADKFDSCKTMEEVKKAVKDIKEMSRKEKPADNQDN